MAEACTRTYSTVYAFITAYLVPRLTVHIMSCADLISSVLRPCLGLCHVRQSLSHRLVLLVCFQSIGKSVASPVLAGHTVYLQQCKSSTECQCCWCVCAHGKVIIVQNNVCRRIVVSSSLAEL